MVLSDMDNNFVAVVAVKSHMEFLFHPREGENVCDTLGVVPYLSVSFDKSDEVSGGGAPGRVDPECCFHVVHVF